MQAYVRIFDAFDYSGINPTLANYVSVEPSLEGVLNDEEERAINLFELLEQDSEERFDKTGFGYALYRFQGSTEYCVELRQLRVIVVKVNTEDGPLLRHFGLIAGVCERSVEDFAAVLAAILDSFYY